MSTIPELLEAVQSLNINQEAVRSIEATAGMIVEFNRDQLKKGFNARDLRIGPRYRNPEYARQKNEQNPEPGLGIPDLILTGAFTDAIGVEVMEEEYEVFSTDAKAPELEKKYNYVLGLGPKKLEQYTTEHVRPVFQERITEVTGLEFD
jgi:hypothetical protein